MQILTTDKVQQFSYGYKLLLPFSDSRHDKTSPINDTGTPDTWEVVVIKPNGEALDKTTSLEFPDNAVAEIAVPIDALDLDQKGTYWYQVTKTTASAVIKSDVESFEVIPSLPVDVTAAPATSANDTYFPFYNSVGALVPSLLRDNAGTLEYNGTPLGSGGGGTPGGSDTQVQYNNAGAFAGSANMVWDNANTKLTLTSGGATKVPFEIKLAASQSGNPIQITTNGGSNGDLVKVDSAGVVHAQGLAENGNSFDFFNGTANYAPWVGLLLLTKVGFGNSGSNYSQITANQNDFNRTSWAGNFLRLSTDASHDLTGVVPFNSGVGDMFFIVNVGSNNLVIKHQNTNSTAGNRFICPGAADLTLGADEAAWFHYDPTDTRWRVFKL